jgi:hypothetical protein
MPGVGAAADYVGLPVGAAIFNHAFVVMSLAHLGRFAEAADHAAEAIPIAEPWKTCTGPTS